MFGLNPVHLLMFGAVALLLCLPFESMLYRHERAIHRGSTMRERLNKFLWTSKFWALLGVVGLASGLYFQRVAANGSGLWCLGLIFLGAAYLEKHE